MIRVWPGLIAATLVALATLGPVLAVFWRAGGGASPSVADWAAVRFTLEQALISAALSVLLAVPVARALARRRFVGRQVLITLMGAPFILPVIVAVLGLLAVFGRSGVVNTGLQALGLPVITIYGLHGVVLAHVFFNLPLATRILLQGWHSIPVERFRLAASLGMPPSAVMRVLELPMLRATLPGAFALILALCLSSFAVALTLGGGPRATTVELAIYQAFRFDFDLGRAAVLAVVQMVLVGTAALLAIRLGRPEGFGTGFDRALPRPDRADGWLRGQDGGVLVLAGAFLGLPLAMVVLKGLPMVLDLPLSIWRAAGISVVVALCSTLISLFLALLIGGAVLRFARLEALGILGLAISPLVIGTGVFMLLNPWVNPAHWAFVITGAVNALVALPFVLRILLPQMRAVTADYARLATTLGMRPRDWLRLVMLPRLRAPLGFAGGLVAALSMGDLGVIALFADPREATLPLQILRLMGSYQMQAAAGAALLLLGLSLALFWIFDRGGRGHADT